MNEVIFAMAIWLEIALGAFAGWLAAFALLAVGLVGVALANWRRTRARGRWR